MKIFIIISIIFFTQISYSNENNDNDKFYKERYDFIKNYIKKLKSAQKENKDYKGNVTETLSGSMYDNFGVVTQKELDQASLDLCKKNGGIECKIRFQSLKKNKNYNRAARYNKHDEILYFLEHKIKSRYISEYKGVIFLRSSKNFNTKYYSCKESIIPVDKVVSLIKKEIGIYPKKFLDNSGLKYIVMCDYATLNVDEKDAPIERIVGGFAPAHYDQSPGVFFINIKNLFNNEDYLKYLFHHEFYHIIDTKLTNIVVDDEWSSLNKNNFLYLNSKIIADAPLTLDNSVKGFASKYARKNMVEDKAELFAMLITRNKDVKKILKKDKILYKKTKLLISRLKNISPLINEDFWNKRN